MEQDPIRLTQFSHGAGCGCKIAPGVLDRILGQLGTQADDPNLLVGHGARDDAAVYDLGDGTAAVSTTDFFMPIVDDPRAFGRIAAANAISDIYAMGGRPADGHRHPRLACEQARSRSGGTSLGRWALHLR